MFIPIWTKEDGISFIHWKVKKIKKQYVFFGWENNYTGKDISVLVLISNEKPKIWKLLFSNLWDKYENTKSGKIGLDGMKWFYEQFVKFDKKISKSRFKKGWVVEIHSTDSQRANVYERFIGKLGYKRGKLVFKKEL